MGASARARLITAPSAHAAAAARRLPAATAARCRTPAPRCTRPSPSLPRARCRCLAPLLRPCCGPAGWCTARSRPVRAAHRAAAALRPLCRCPWRARCTGGRCAGRKASRALSALSCVCPAISRARAAGGQMSVICWRSGWAGGVHIWSQGNDGFTSATTASRSVAWGRQSERPRRTGRSVRLGAEPSKDLALLALSGRSDSVAGTAAATCATLSAQGSAHRPHTGAH